MAPHSSTLAWKFPLMEKPGRLPSMGSLEEWDTTERLHFHFSLSCIGEGNSNPLQCSCLENPRDGAAWWAAIHGVAQSQKLLKRLSSSIDETKHNSSKHPQVSLRNISKFLLFIVVTKIICNCHSFPRLVSQWFIFNCDFFWLEDNCFTVLCWPPPRIDMNQPQVYPCPFLPEAPSPLPSFPPSRLSQSTGLSRLCSFPLELNWMPDDIYFNSPKKVYMFSSVTSKGTGPGDETWMLNQNEYHSIYFKSERVTLGHTFLMAIFISVFLRV